MEHRKVYKNRSKTTPTRDNEALVNLAKKSKFSLSDGFDCLTVDLLPSIQLQ